MTKALIAALFVALIVAIATPARADMPASPAPAKVNVGVYVNHIYGIDIKNNQFNVDFYIWFRWEGDDIKPFETFELANGRITSKTGLYRKKIGTTSYANVRVVATITKFWDLRRFPLDDHMLALEIEDVERDTRSGAYIADADNEAVSPDVQVPGWVVTGSQGRTATHLYRTNYGDTSFAHDRESSYSRYIFEIDIERPGYGRFLKVFFGLFISVLISWCAFHVRPKESSPRVSLGVGATFAAAAVTVAINNSLPDTNDVTMADKLIMLTLGMILASVVETIVALLLVARGREPLQQRLDKICALAFPAFYLGMLALIIS